MTDNNDADKRKAERAKIAARALEQLNLRPAGELYTVEAILKGSRRVEFKPLSPQEPSYDLKELARAIAKAFNAPEFEELLMALEIDSADIGGDSMKAKAISLVQLCRRYNRLKDLVKECRSERPKVDWNVEKK